MHGYTVMQRDGEWGVSCRWKRKLLKVEGGDTDSQSGSKCDSKMRSPVAG